MSLHRWFSANNMRNLFHFAKRGLIRNSNLCRHSLTKKLLLKAFYDKVAAKGLLDAMDQHDDADDVLD